MSEQIIRFSDNAAESIKAIMSKAKISAIGVRVGVKSGGCAGMSYVMELSLIHISEPTRRRGISYAVY